MQRSNSLCIFSRQLKIQNYEFLRIMIKFVHEIHSNKIVLYSKDKDKWFLWRFITAKVL